MRLLSRGQGPGSKNDVITDISIITNDTKDRAIYVTAFVFSSFKEFQNVSTTMMSSGGSQPL